MSAPLTRTGTGGGVSAPLTRTGTASTGGQLKSIGVYRMGAWSPEEYVRCQDCGTDFPRIAGFVRCNGHAIDFCPWCRADSAPWTRGRCV